MLLPRIVRCGSVLAFIAALAVATPTRAETPDILVLEPFAGYSYVHLKAFSQDSFEVTARDIQASGGTLPSGVSVDDVLVDTKGDGYTLGVAAGLRLSILVLGVRFGMTDAGSFNVGTTMLELMLRPSLGPIEPYVRSGFGLAWQGSGALDGYSDDSSVFGFGGGLGLGLDVRVHHNVAIGAGIDGDILNLNRETDFSQAGTIDTTSLPADGTAVGFQMRLQGHVTIHI